MCDPVLSIIGVIALLAGSLCLAVYTWKFIAFLVEIPDRFSMIEGAADKNFDKNLERFKYIEDCAYALDKWVNRLYELHDGTLELLHSYAKRHDENKTNITFLLKRVEDLEGINRAKTKKA